MSSVPDDVDAAVRLRAFDFLADLRQRFSDAPFPRGVLDRGFDFYGTRVPLVCPQGIFKPAILLEVPLTITTAPPVEGRDLFFDDRLPHRSTLYPYRGTDPNHRDNVGL